ncbi:MAG: energy transducer TonB [Elusimicrobiota bacterium]
MKGYFALSLAAHSAFFGFLMILGTLLARPRLAYYSIDLFSMPSGTPGGSPAAATVSPPPSPGKTAAKPEEFQRVVPHSKALSKEAIRLIGKVKKKVLPKPAVVSKPKPSSNFEAAMRALGREDNQASGAGTGGATGLPGNSGGGGSGIVAEAGTTFPYPWYLKSIADRLDKQWHPSQEFEADTVCQVAFVIHRDGQLSESKIEKPSGDTFFDQLALRAVLYSNPLPPLPSGFPDDTLRVHMKFVGKRI